MTTDEAASTSPRRLRSARYPGVTLNEAITLASQLAERGVDGLPAEAIAAAMGYKNIRTQTSSASLSSARQFGLIRLKDRSYSLTELGQQLISAGDLVASSLARREAFQRPPLYAELCARFAGKRVPDAAALANWLQHNHHITASAKLSAAEVFLTSAREAAVLGADCILRIDETVAAPVPPTAEPTPTASPQSSPRRTTASAEVEFVLQLWGADETKFIRVSAPRAITAESLERLLQAFRLHVKISDP